MLYTYSLVDFLTPQNRHMRNSCGRAPCRGDMCRLAAEIETRDRGMALPDLSGLAAAPSASGWRRDWERACGERPVLKPWRLLKSREKFDLLHSIAEMADDDYEPEGGYVSVYEEIDIDDIPQSKRSVEHVIPRVRVNGKAPGAAEDDPLGWVEATKTANSRRGSYPLFLWLEDAGELAPPNRLVRLDGELHYVPPVEQRARLARKWLYMRASYTGTIDPPSRAQRRNAARIVALAKSWPVQPAERRANAALRGKLGCGNPLLESKAGRFYDDAGWRAAATGEYL